MRGNYAYGDIMLDSKQGKIRIEDVNQASCDQNQKYCLFIICQLFNLSQLNLLKKSLFRKLTMYPKVWTVIKWILHKEHYMYI